MKMGGKMRRQVGIIAAAVSSVAALSLTVAASGCASSRTAIVNRGAPSGPSSGDWKTVRYRDVLLEVPGSWPVVDLAANPKRCVLFNVHAVYLGHQGPDATCPAHALGRTEAVQVEPYDAQTRAHLLPSASRATIHGEQVTVEPDADSTRTVVASFVQLAVTVTATYLTDPALANRIVQSVQGVPGATP
jgi:hypothetical protein